MQYNQELFVYLFQYFIKTDYLKCSKWHCRGGFSTHHERCFYENVLLVRFKLQKPDNPFRRGDDSSPGADNIRP